MSLTKAPIFCGVLVNCGAQIARLHPDHACLNPGYRYSLIVERLNVVPIRTQNRLATYTYPQLKEINKFRMAILDTQTIIADFNRMALVIGEIT
jgi:hypothetical protein